VDGESTADDEILENPGLTWGAGESALVGGTPDIAAEENPEGGGLSPFECGCGAGNVIKPGSSACALAASLFLFLVFSVLPFDNG